MLTKHLPDHPHPTMDREPRRACWWLDPEMGAPFSPRLAGFGHDGCHEHVEAVRDGLRYSTETADLIAVNDGREFGVYLFRTKGGRYFTVRINWPFRHDRSEPLEVVSQGFAQELWAQIGTRPWAAVAPYAEAFPGLEVIQDA